MKITLKETTIEADAKELRESRTLADCLTALLMSCVVVDEDGCCSYGEQNAAESE